MNAQSIHRPSRLIFTFFAVALLWVGIPFAALGQIRYVSATGTNTNPASATSWATSTTNLQGAINSLSATGGQVWVASGIYKPGGSANISRATSFAMLNGVTIYGGFAGTETALSQRVLTSPSTSTLSGEIGSPASTTDNSYHVISNPSGLTTTAVLDGFVITGGNADGISPHSFGGGMFNNGAGAGNQCSPLIRNCLFLNNQASLNGGAVYNNGTAGGNSSPVLTNCTFQSNTANYGGAVYNDGSGSGSVSNPNLTNCSFLANQALFNGGAMYNNAQSNGISFAVLTNCEFRNNASAYEGGALYNDGTSSGQSSPRLTNCAFVSNTAVSSSGGVMYNNGGTGASSPSLVNCSLLNNRGSQFGGAMHNVGTSGSSSPTLTNCIVFGNGGNNTFRNDDATVTANYSFLDGAVLGYSGSNNLGNFNSPFVSTTPGQPASVALNSCSQAINAGNPASVTVAAGPYSALALPATDLTGNLRIAGGQVDLGAVEFQPGAVQLPTRLYVQANATGANTGLTWADAFTDLQAALSYPCNTNLTEIWVATGVYKPVTTTGPGSRTVSFAMRNGVAIYGGFVGTEAALSQRPVINPVSGNPSSSTLSGEIGDPASTTDNSYHVIRNANGLTATAILDGFVITGGRANGNTFPDNVGGGMYNNGAGFDRYCSPTITNCFFFSNQGSINGGAIYNNGRTSGSSSPVLTNCYFQYNAATTSGGALYNDGTASGNSSPRLTNCAFLINGASSDNGGAMYNDGGGGTSSPVLLNCSFQGNVAAPLGGAMYNNGTSGSSSPVLTNCVLFGNNGNNTITNIGASLTATYSLFEPSSVTVAGVNISGPGNLTTTVSPFASFTSIALATNSPAINAGDPATTPTTGAPAAVGTTDLAGNSRFVGGRIDMGAFESPCTVTRLYVWATATGANTGLTWADAFTDLQAALSYPCSQSLTEVWVATGSYKPTGTTGPASRTISFAMKNGVTIYGGFAGNETNLGQRPAIGLSTPSSTTLSGDIGTVGNATDNSYHVISNPAGLTATAILDGFVITGGNANGTFPDNNGGGVYNDGSGRGKVCSPTLSRCFFLNNQADLGGAIYNYGTNGGSSSPALTNCWFQGNTATGSGGAILNDGSGGGSSSSPRLINCSFVGNGTVGQGGGLYNYGSAGGSSSPVLTNCSFLNNTALSGGGAIYSTGQPAGVSNLTITNGVLWGNGGANTFANTNATVTLRYSFVEPAVTNYTSGPGNLTTTTSPVASPTTTRLRPGSPAINTGDPATTTATVGSTDLAGLPRFVGGRIDMGAVEVQDEMFTIATGNWNNPAIWNVGRIPQVGDRARLKHAVTIPASYVGVMTTLVYDPVGRLIYSAGGRLRLEP